MISWYLFRAPILLSRFFVRFFRMSCFIVSSLSFFVLREPYFFGAVNTKVAMTHLWSLPMWIMSLASASLLYLHLISFRGSVTRLFTRSLPVHRVDCCEILHHQPMFHPISSLVSSVECVFTNTCTFNSHFLLLVVCFSIILCIFSTWWSAYPEWSKNTFTSLMRWWFTMIVAVMAHSLMYSVSIIFLSPLPVQQNANSVFVVIFACSHEHVFLVCFPNF